MGIVTVLWALIGYSMAFGPVSIPTLPSGVSSWNPDQAAPSATAATKIIGNAQLGLMTFSDQLRQIGWSNGGVATTWTDPGATPVYLNVTETTYNMFQLMFAIVTVAIISGGVVGRIKYAWFMAFAALWHLLIYCPLAHWIFFYDGWLFTFGVLDFAGGLVVHLASGASALTLAYWLGNSKQAKHDPHSVPYVLLGAALLWFGWFGFNAGSALTAGNNQSARVFANTQIATASAMMTWGGMEMIFGGDRLFTGRASAVGAATGAVVGLVAITPGCGYVTQMWSIFIGFFTVVVCYFGPRLVHMLGIDDRLDCFAYHGIGGATGAILTGLFATADWAPPNAVNGAFYGNGRQLGIQIVGVLVTFVYSVIGTTIIFWFLQIIAWALKMDMRISEAHAGDLDVSQHGEKAYFRAARPFSIDAGAAGLPAVASETKPAADFKPDTAVPVVEK